VNPNAGMIGMAFPGTFIVDRYGRVTFRFFEEFYRNRHTASSLMMALGGRAGAVAGAQISTDHLEIRTYATDNLEWRLGIDCRRARGHAAARHPHVLTGRINLSGDCAHAAAVRLSATKLTSHFADL